MASQMLDLSIRRSGRRSRLEAYIDILHVIAEGVEKPTHIMYKANLSWTSLQAYLKALVQRGMIIEGGSKGQKKYLLTKGGIDAITHFLRLKDTMNLKGIQA